METKDNSLGNSILETQKKIDNLENKLTKLEEIERVKTDLQNQIIVLLSQRSQITGTEIGQLREAMREEVKEMLAQGREPLKETRAEKQSEEDKKIEELASTRDKEALQSMLAEALALYREGKYKESIRKWEEVLVIDPENLEAKFNIEIAREKFKSLSEK